MRALMVKMATQLAGQTGKHQDAQMVAYGLELLVDGLIQLLVILVLAQFLGTLDAVAAAVAVAMVYRRFSGGVHCTAFHRCLVVSTAAFLGIGYLTFALEKYGYFYGFYLVAMVTTLWIAFRWAPAENPVKPIPTEEKRVKLRKKSLLSVGVGAILLFGICFFRLLPPFVVTAMALGFLWQSFTITPWGYRFIGWLDRCLTIG